VIQLQFNCASSLRKIPAHVPYADVKAGDFAAIELCLDHHRLPACSSKNSAYRARSLQHRLVRPIPDTLAWNAINSPFAAYVGPNFIPRQGPWGALSGNIFSIDLAVRLHSERDRYCNSISQKKDGNFHFHESCRFRFFSQTKFFETCPNDLIDPTDAPLPRQCMHPRCACLPAMCQYRQTQDKEKTHPGCNPSSTKSAGHEKSRRGTSSL
jgi:hypothetical protein